VDKEELKKMESELKRKVKTIERLVNSKGPNIDKSAQGKYLFAIHADKIIPKKVPEDNQTKIQTYFDLRQLFEEGIYDLPLSNNFYRAYSDSADSYFHNLHRVWKL